MTRYPAFLILALLCTLQGTLQARSPLADDRFTQPQAAQLQVDEGLGDSLSPEQVAALRAWTVDSKASLSELLARVKTMSAKQARDEMETSIRKVVLLSDGRENETLMRFVLNRALKVVEYLKASGEHTGSVDEQLAVLVRSVKLALTEDFLKSDEAALNGSSTFAARPYAQFGVNFAEYLLGVNQGIVAAKAQYEIGVFALGLLLKDLARDPNAATFANSQTVLDNELTSLKNLPPPSDADYVSRYRGIRDAYALAVSQLKGTPLQIPRLKEVQAVAVGGGHTCVVVAGNAFCWGVNRWGQLGNGAFGGYSSTPVQVKGLSQVTAITAGKEHTCAIARGEVYCWGFLVETTSPTDAHFGENPLPRKMGLPNAVQITANDDDTCALADNHVFCWGMNTNSSWPNPASWISYSLTGWSSTPVVFPGSDGASDIALGPTHTCMLRKKEVHCAGKDGEGQLGRKKVNEWKTMWKPVKVDLPGKITGLMIAGSKTCALSNQGLYCWGEGAFEPYRVQELNAFSGAPLAINYHCTSINGLMMCWDDNHYNPQASASAWEMTDTEVVGLENLQSIELGVGRVGLVSVSDYGACAVVDLASGYQELYCWAPGTAPSQVQGLDQIPVQDYSGPQPPDVTTGSPTNPTEPRFIPAGYEADPKCWTTFGGHPLYQCISDKERKELHLPKGVYTQTEAARGVGLHGWEADYRAHPITSRLKCVATMGWAPGCPPP